MNYPLVVLSVNYVVIGGIEEAKLMKQAFKPFLLIAMTHKGTRFIVDGGYVIDSVAYGIDIHHGTAGKDEHLVAAKFIGYDL